MNEELNKQIRDSLQWFADEAQKCTDNAARARKTFRRLAVSGMVWLCIFPPFATLLIRQSGIFTKIVGIGLLTIAVFMIWMVRDSITSGNKFSTRWLELRQQCLDEITKIRNFRDQLRGYTDE